MKICFVHNLYTPYAVGGAERIVETLAEKAKQSGNTPIVITVVPQGSGLELRTVENGVIVYRVESQYIFPYQQLGSHSIFSKVLWHLQDMFGKKQIRQIQQILEKEAPDFVHTHNLMGVGFQLPAILSTLGITHRHTVHDVQLVEPSGILPWNHTTDSFFERWYSSQMRKMFAGVDEVVYPTAYMKNFYESRGFFSNATSVVQKVTPAKKTVQTKEHAKNLLFVGSLVPHKGIAVLMQIWEALPDKDTRVLHIAGDGELLEHVQEWAKLDHRVTVYGRLDKAKLQELYDECDVLLFTSTCIENRPNVITEALAHGLPVIAAKTGGVPELVNDTLVEPGNVQAYVDALLKNKS